MKLFFDDAEFDGQLQRSAAKVATGACDLGELFAIASRITPGDYDSWHDEWFASGEQAVEVAEGLAAGGHDVSAGDAFVRASEAFRSSYFFCRREPTAPVLLDAFHRCRDAFRAAAPLLPFEIDQVQIPYEGVHLEGYTARQPGATGPTVLMPSGYDMPVEEFWTLGGLDAARRGCTVVAFSGPGQAEMLYERGIPFRHDYEAGISSVIDWAEGVDGLDTDRLAIWGRSFGGYLAPRAASVEHRIGALAADPAQTDMWSALEARFPKAWLDLIEADDPTFDDELFAANPGVQGQEFWMSRARAHGCDTVLAYAREMQRWVVDVEAIECPTRVSYGEGDFAQATADTFYDRLRTPKSFQVYKEADGGAGHCEGMGPTRYLSDVLAWMGEQLPG